jgi:hypothetical protein
MQVSGSYARTKSRIDKKCFRGYRWLTMPATSPEALRRKAEARIAKRSQVRNLVESVIAPTPELSVIPSPEPVVIAATLQPDTVTITPAISCDDALQSWRRTKQYADNVTLRGINPQRLQSVIQSRVEAAFRAGYSAGVGDAI